jgi:hypothetical protein
LGSVALDLDAGPAIAIDDFAISRSEVVHATSDTPKPAPPPEVNSGPVPRLLVGARLGLSPHSVFRTFIGVDAELGATRSTVRSDQDAARLPAFTVGAALGATVGSE